MATLNATLTLASTDASSDTLNLTVTDSLTIGPPSTGVSQTACEASTGSVISLKPTGSANQYTYVKHTGYQTDGSTATTNQLVVKFGTTESLRLAAGEFAFFPTKSNVVVNAISSSSHTILIEHGYWTAA